MFEYFYDSQLRRFLLQIVRAFSGFQYQVGGRNGEPPYLKVVPCKAAPQSKQVGHIMRNNSENTLLSVPQISVFIREVAIARDRTQAPGFVSTVQVDEREYDEETASYTSKRGNGYTVERMMPHPLDVTVQVDVWTSNEHQKHQLFEQIFMAFNVGFDIQSSSNPVDWTALTTMRLDSVTWSSRSVPIGTNEEIDVMSFTFMLPVWISPPAKVKQQKLIHQINANISEAQSISFEEDLEMGYSFDSTSTLMARHIVTPDNAMIHVESDRITLLGSDGAETDVNGQVYQWQKLLAKYGQFKPAQSQLRLRANIEQDPTLDVVGTIQIHPNKPNVLLWQVDIDTLPGNTLKPIDAIINPLKNAPGAGLPPATIGQRYLILEDIGPSVAWGDIRAKVGDILEYKNNVWVVDFAAFSATEPQYVVNQTKGKQLKFVDSSWILSIDGTYNPGFWRLKI